LFDLGSIYWYYLKDQKAGEKYYRELIVAYPDDDLAISALATLGEWEPDSRKQPKPRQENSQTAQVVKKFALLQNYPNPFNPETNIKYALPEESYVLIEVYNILGKKITTILDTEMQEGYHIVKWDGRNSTGQKVSAGIYLVRMKVGSFEKTQKMMLLP